MSIVVDLGCARFSHIGGGLNSVALLIERFHPEHLYGFDPLITVEEATVEGTHVKTSTSAAWIWDGVIDYAEDGVASCLAPDGDPLLPRHMSHKPQPPKTVACFDLARFLSDLSEPAVVKMDCEGAEYLLLTWLLATGAIRTVELLLIEWHAQTRDREAWRARLEPEVRAVCAVEEWAY